MNAKRSSQYMGWVSRIDDEKYSATVLEAPEVGPDFVKIRVGCGGNRGVYTITLKEDSRGKRSGRWDWSERDGGEPSGGVLDELEIWREGSALLMNCLMLEPYGDEPDEVDDLDLHLEVDLVNSGLFA